MSAVMVSGEDVNKGVLQVSMLSCLALGKAVMEQEQANSGAEKR